MAAVAAKRSFGDILETSARIMECAIGAALLLRRRRTSDFVLNLLLGLHLLYLSRLLNDFRVCNSPL